MTEIIFAVPFYSNATYLEKCLKSVLSQSISCWRCVVIDDCGTETEEARKTVESFNDNRFAFLKNDKNLGLAKNWNACLNYARELNKKEFADCKLVSILHADDELRSDYLETILKLQRQFPESAFYFTQAEIIGEDSKKKFSFVDSVKVFFRPKSSSLGKLCGEPLAKKLAKGNFIMCPTIAYKLEAIRGENFDPNWKMVLDLEFYFRIALKGFQISGTSKQVFRYRRHSDNQTVKLTEDLTRFSEECELLEHFGLKFEEKGWAEAAKIAQKKRIVLMNLIFNILKDLVGLKFKAVSRKVSFVRQRRLI